MTEINVSQPDQSAEHIDVGVEVADMHRELTERPAVEASQNVGNMVLTSEVMLGEPSSNGVTVEAGAEDQLVVTGSGQLARRSELER